MRETPRARAKASSQASFRAQIIHRFMATKALYLATKRELKALLRPSKEITAASLVGKSQRSVRMQVVSIYAIASTCR